MRFDFEGALRKTKTDAGGAGEAARAELGEIVDERGRRSQCFVWFRLFIS